MNIKVILLAFLKTGRNITFLYQVPFCNYGVLCGGQSFKVTEQGQGVVSFASEAENSFISILPFSVVKVMYGQLLSEAK